MNKIELVQKTCAAVTAYAKPGLPPIEIELAGKDPAAFLRRQIPAVARLLDDASVSDEKKIVALSAVMVGADTDKRFAQHMGVEPFSTQQLLLKRVEKNDRTGRGGRYDA